MVAARPRPPAGYHLWFSTKLLPLSPAALGYIYSQKMQNRLLAATITDLALRNLFRIEVTREGLIFKDNEYHFKSSGLSFIPADYEDFGGQRQGTDRHIDPQGPL